MVRPRNLSLRVLFPSVVVGTLAAAELSSGIGLYHWLFAVFTG